MTVTWASALGWRLRRQHLVDQRADSVEAVVDRLVAVPAWSGDARTAVRLRLNRPAEGDLADAVAAGRVIVTYAFRGSTHYLTPATAAVHLALRCAGRQWELTSWRTFYDLAPQDWPRLRSVVREALRGGPLTQQELAGAVSADPAFRHLLPAVADRSQTLLKPLAWQGDLCLSPAADGPSFRSLESVPGWSGLVELDQAGPAAIRAYLAAYGPAPRDRIDYWLGEGLSAGRRRIAGWIDDLGDELVVLSIEDTEAFCLAEHVDDVLTAEATDRVVLVPGADQWILGAGTSDTRIVPSRHRSLATRGANLVLIGGRVSGTWKLTGEQIDLTWLDGVTSIPPAALSSAVERLALASGRQLRLADH
jgi:hypothetical protein